VPTFREKLVRAQAPGLDALDKLPTHEGAGMAPSVRAMDVFGKAPTSIALPLNRKTTASEVVSLPLDTPLEPRQEHIPVAGLQAYVVKPRRDPPDVAHVLPQDGGQGRYLIQEGHTRLGAAKLRGDASLDARVWQFQEHPDGSIQPVPRGRHRQGLKAGGQLSHREKLAILMAETDPLSTVPDWQLGREGLYRRFDFENLRAQGDFLSALMHAANAANHHPDVQTDGNSVLVTFCTHAENDAVTEQDYESARQSDLIAAQSRHVLSYRERLAILLGGDDWDETKHPRDEKGRFGSGGGGDTTHVNAAYDRIHAATGRTSVARAAIETASAFGFPYGKLEAVDMRQKFGQYFGKNNVPVGVYQPNSGVASFSKEASAVETTAILAHELSHDAYYEATRGSTPEAQEFKEFTKVFASDLAKEDGVTRYSASYWQRGSQSQAVNETLAEMSRLKVGGGQASLAVDERTVGSQSSLKGMSVLSGRDVNDRLRSSTPVISHQGKAVADVWHEAHSLMLKAADSTRK
jgi:4a-hydroxytetrahydrobiopterin dehydratase